MPEGTAKIDWGSGSAEGVWRIVDDKVCATYKDLFNGSEKCYVLYKTGENVYKVFVNGLYNGSFSYTN